MKNRYFGAVQGTRHLFLHICGDCDIGRSVTDFLNFLDVYTFFKIFYFVTTLNRYTAI